MIKLWTLRPRFFLHSHIDSIKSVLIIEWTHVSNQRVVWVITWHIQRITKIISGKIFDCILQMNILNIYHLLSRHLFYLEFLDFSDSQSIKCIVTSSVILFTPIYSLFSRSKQRIILTDQFYVIKLIPRFGAIIRSSKLGR